MTAITTIKKTTYTLTILTEISTELMMIEKLVFNAIGHELKQLVREAESQEYDAHQFELSGKQVKFRLAKVTPKKIGQFVTIWKRNDEGVTQAFDIADEIERFIIATRKENKLGIFIFPKKILHENKILSDSTNIGKRGIRVYPPWDITTNKQAQKTQTWQTPYFLDLTYLTQIDLTRARKLLLG